MIVDDPRQESLYDMFKKNICPTFTFKSCTFLIIVLNFLFYVALLIYGGFEPDSLNFLAVKKETLILFGENSPYFVRFSFQFSRLFLSLFLSSNSYQFLFNSILLMILGSHFEAATNFKNMFSIYFVSGIAGELFSDLFTDYPTLGNTGAILGILGGFLSKVFYVGLSNGARREILVLLFLVIFIITMIILMMPISQSLNLIGGFLFGMIFAFVLVIREEEQTRFRKYMKVFCLSLTIAFMNVGFFTFYISRRPVYIGYQSN